jgi:DNA-binding NarL/FixJ family response regulator
VLLVDDTDMVRQRVAACIAAVPGITAVIEAVDGDDALARIDSSAPDIVVLDIQMPRRNGFAVLSALSERNPALPVIVLTDHVQYGEYVLERGAAAFFDKATEIDALCDAIERLALALRARARVSA